MIIYSTVEEGLDRIKELWAMGEQFGHNSPYRGMMNKEIQKVREDLVTLFGKINPKYPDCETCLWNSVFGGPSHYFSERCRSGRKPHCTCDLCY